MLETWVQTPLAQALGSALLHSVWQGAAAAAVLAGLLYLVRPARSTAAAAAGLLVLGWTTPTTAAPQQAESMTKYEKWLVFDVGYIIEPEEKIAFEALKSDEERDRFIGQFWERRDPTPGTPANEFREEHYRRIAYANDRFATSALAGSGTDTGRIYIIVGPPDEIEMHPSGGGSQAANLPPGAPWQAWRYRGNGVPTDYLFADTDGDGAYELVRQTP